MKKKKQTRQVKCCKLFFLLAPVRGWSSLTRNPSQALGKSFFIRSDSQTRNPPTSIPRRIPFESPPDISPASFPSLLASSATAPPFFSLLLLQAWLLPRRTAILRTLSPVNRTYPRFSIIIKLAITRATPP